MSDFNQPTRRQDQQTPSTTPPTGQQTRETEHGSIERNPDAPNPDAAKSTTTRKLRTEESDGEKG
jgi:hypothetical protein